MDSPLIHPLNFAGCLVLSHMPLLSMSYYLCIYIIGYFFDQSQSQLFDCLRLKGRERSQDLCGTWKDVSK